MNKGWIALFCGYFALQMLVRLSVGPALELDEAEALFHARTLAVGYSAQPPLYFWLQWGLFQVFGPGLLALALLKAILLSGIVTAVFALLKQAVSPNLAGISTLSLSLLPQISWEAQRALTHSVLVLLTSVLVILTFWAVLTKGRWRDYLLFGVILGLGCLSKYNFGILPLGLLMAALISGYRLKPLRLCAALAVAGAMVTPVLFWIAAHPDVASGSVYKLGLGTMGPVMARLTGAGAFIAALLAFWALPIVVLGWLAWRRDRTQPLTLPPLVRFIGLGAVCALVLLALGVLVAGGTAVKDRWLLPLAWPAVPVAVILLWPALSNRQQKQLTGLIGALWLVAAAGLPYASLRDPGYRAADFPALLAEVNRIAPGTTTIIDTPIWIAGNLALIAPDLTLSLSVNPLPATPSVIITDIPAAVLENPDIAARARAPVPYTITRGRHVMQVSIIALR